MSRALDSDTVVMPPAPSGPAAAPAEDFGRKVEDWVADNLEPNAGRRGRTGDWRDKIDEMPLLRRMRPGAKGRAQTEPTQVKGWVRINPIARRGGTVVRLKDQMILKESDIAELSEELLDLIAAGQRRLALDFAAVERLSSQLAPVLDKAGRRCAAEGDGMLKLYNLRPEVAGVIALTKLGKSVTVAPDETTALEGPWPERPGLRPLPEAIIASLATPKTGKTHPSPEPEVVDEENAETEPSDPPRLVVACGRAKGRELPLDEAGLFVGRDPGCRLRTASDTVSRKHAHLRAVGGRVYLRDLGSTNGTLLNGRLLRGQEVEVHAGDRLEIGPLTFTFAFGPAPARGDGRALREEEIIGWLGLDCYSDGDSGPAASDEVTSFDLEGTAQQAGPTRPIRCQVIEDTVVVTPLNSHVVEELDVESLRQELLDQLEKVLPRRVVVNLQHVISLSGAAVGMLVAHHLRLDRVGGALRLCAANARVATAIDQIRLPMLLEVYPTVDEAVLAVWDRDERSA